MDDKPIFNVSQMTDSVFGSMVKRRYNEASAHWETKYKLRSTRQSNERNYLASYVEEQLLDERYQEVYSDNRLFVAVRTLLPFLTARITAPEVTPANGDDASVQFARDFEEVLQRHAEKQQGRGKIRLAVQDILRGQRAGYLKWRYDANTDNVVLEFVPANAVTVGKRSKLLEEPDFLRHTQERSIGDLVRQFPDKKEKILDHFGVTRGTPSQMERMEEVNEDWIWCDIDGKNTLVVGWSHNDFTFGKMTDPNFDEGGNNVIEQSMIPFVSFNFLNDGSGWIDQTSFIEQSKWSQSNYNKRGQTIAESAKYGGTGVPIFAKTAITQKDVAKIRFSPIQRVLLDTPDVGKAFTTWQSSPLQPYIIEDKRDLAESIDNTWGIPDVLRGQQTDSRTLGQDLLVRNQSEGRQADPIDCIDEAMDRFYNIEAQMMYRYFDKKKFYNYIGDDGKFVSIVVSNKDIRENLGIVINVKAGTSLPIDRAQKRALIMELMKAGKVSVLTGYKELGIFDDPEEAYKQLIMEETDPIGAVQGLDKVLRSREAEQDLQAAIAGETPKEREDIGMDYMQHLTDYLMTNKFHMLAEKNPKAAERVEAFVQNIIDQAKLKMAKAQSQEPMGGSSPPGAPTDDPVASNYRHAPPDIQAQIEARQGYQPSPLHEMQTEGGQAHVGVNSSTIVQPPQQPGMEGLLPGMPQLPPTELPQNNMMLPPEDDGQPEVPPL